MPFPRLIVANIEFDYSVSVPLAFCRNKRAGCCSAVIKRDYLSIKETAPVRGLSTPCRDNPAQCSKSKVFFMETVCLNKPDLSFIRAVEDESGQVVSRCYQCGNCTAGCPMSFTFDFTVSRIMRLIQTGQRKAVLNSKAVWLCATCETCTQRCPNNIDVASVMDACRHMSRREGYGGVYAVKAFFDSFVTTMGLHGRTHEIGLMAMFMGRTGRVWTDVELAPKMLPKGKMAILPHRIEGRKEVADILRRFKEGAADEAVVRAKLAVTGQEASAMPGGSASRAPAVNSAPAPSVPPADPSGAPAPLPDCGDSPTPQQWEGSAKDKEARS